MLCELLPKSVSDCLLSASTVAIVKGRKRSSMHVKSVRTGVGGGVGCDEGDSCEGLGGFVLGVIHLGGGV